MDKNAATCAREKNLENFYSFHCTNIDIESIRHKSPDL